MSQNDQKCTSLQIVNKISIMRQITVLKLHINPLLPSHLKNFI